MGLESWRGWGVAGGEVFSNFRCRARSEGEGVRVGPGLRND